MLLPKLDDISLNLALEYSDAYSKAFSSVTRTFGATALLSSCTRSSVASAASTFTTLLDLVAGWFSRLPSEPESLKNSGDEGVRSCVIGFTSLSATDRLKGLSARGSGITSMAAPGPNIVFFFKAANKLFWAARSRDDLNFKLL